MKILYILAVLSFLALGFAAIAIARHIRKGAARAANPHADNELSDAIDLRLHDLVRPARDPRPAAQDFSYFNKEAPARLPTETPDHSKTAPHDRN
jgi:hypothetical protein